MKAVAALMLMTAVVFAAGCTKPDDTNNGGDNNGDINDIGYGVRNYGYSVRPVLSAK